MHFHTEMVYLHGILNFSPLLRVSAAFNFPSSLHTMEPAHSILSELFYSGLQFSLVQIEIIHSTDS